MGWAAGKDRLPQRTDAGFLAHDCQPGPVSAMGGLLGRNTPYGDSMSDDHAQPPASSQADRDLEREIRAGRTYSMEEALGRLAGPGGMKGASPVLRQQQARAAIDDLVRQHLSDPAGVLKRVLSREVGESRALLDDLDRPQVALGVYVRQLLASEYLLSELVRMTDMEWGQVLGERPFFEVEGRPAHPDDPYTIASVRSALGRFLDALPAAVG